MWKKDKGINKGIFIVIEGTDGSGKGTQFKLLSEQLANAGYDIATFDFPRYDHPSSYFVKEYLNGRYGSAEEVGPYTGSLFYALDRYDASAQIREALEAGKIVLANRFTGSNMAHQGTKFNNPDERRGYFIWLDNLEFEMLKIPRPDMNVVLRVPADIAQQLVDQKEERSYTDKKRDLHEADLNHLKRAVEVYDDLGQLFPKDFLRIDCVRSGELLSIDDINRLICEKVAPILPRPARVKKSSEAKAEAGEHAKADLGEIANNAEDKDAEFAARTAVTQNTVSAQRSIVVENASDFLLQKLEQNHILVATDRPVFDEKDADGRYRYFIPEHLNMATKKVYRQFMDGMFEKYALLVDELTHYVREHDKTSQAKRDENWKKATRAQACTAARQVLPVAAASTATVSVSDASLTQLLADELPEAQTAARKIAAAFPEDNVSPAKATAIELLQELAAKHLPDNHADDRAEAVELTDVWPRNELDLVPDMLYEHSNLPLAELRKTANTWPYEQKLKVFNTYMSQRSRQVLEKTHYSWDVLSDYSAFRTVQHQQLIKSPAWQQLTPRYGYEIPKLVEDAGKAEDFEACFEVSLKLYSVLQQAGYALEAQYATLQGHRMRWKVTMNACEAIRLSELRGNHDPLAQQIHEKLSEVHPLIASSTEHTKKAIKT
jgi:dTMP kinase